MFGSLRMIVPAAWGVGRDGGEDRDDQRQGQQYGTKSLQSLLHNVLPFLQEVLAGSFSEDFPKRYPPPIRAIKPQSKVLFKGFSL